MVDSDRYDMHDVFHRVVVMLQNGGHPEVEVYVKDEGSYQFEHDKMMVLLHKMKLVPIGDET